MRVLATALVLLGLTSCGAVGDTPATVDLVGTVTPITASSGGRGYLIELAEGMLPLEVGIGAPPPGTTGVVVEVPDGIDLPDDADGRFGVLSAWTVQADRGLTVVDYLP